MPDNKEDIVNTPIEIAQRLYRLQIDSFQKSVPHKPNPVKGWLKEQGISLKTLREG